MSEKISNKSVVSSVLNQVLAGERMAIRSYNSSLTKVADEDLQKFLTAFQSDHKLIIEKIKARMRSLGIDPKNSLGLVEGLDRIVMEVASLVGINSEDDDIIEKIYNNEAKALQKITGIKTDELDSISQKLIERIKVINTNNLNQLKDLLEK
jgi:hypothetical protein